MCACHVERSEAKSKHLQKDTIPLEIGMITYLMRLTYFTYETPYIQSRC